MPLTQLTQQPQQGEIAMYATIVSVSAPASALAGERVDIQVKIRNDYSSSIGIMVGGALEYGVSPWPGITFSVNQANVDFGVTYAFNGYFTMPDKDVTLHAYSYYYGSDGYWHFDNEKTVSVELSAIVTWVLLAQVPIPINEAPTVTTWVLLAQKSISVIAAPIVTNWVLLDSRSVAIGIAAIVWQLLDSRSITIIGGVTRECSVDADCPEGYVCVNGICVPKEKAGFPWVPVALAGGAAIVIAAAATKKKKPKVLTK